MDFVTSWERKGIEKGRLDGFRSVLLDVLTTRFGPLDPSVTERVGVIDSVDQLRRMMHLAVTASSMP